MTDDPRTPPALEFAFEVHAAIGESVRIGRSADEVLVFTPVTGGLVEGPRLRGVVLPGGGDWSTTRGAATELEARYLLRAEDGTVIDIVNRGFWRASAEVEARLAAGGPVAESEYYFRTSPVFRTDSATHGWLTETVLVGVARDENDGHIRIRFFEVK